MNWRIDSRHWLKLAAFAVAVVGTLWYWFWPQSSGRMSSDGTATRMDVSRPSDVASGVGGNLPSILHYDQESAAERQGYYDALLTRTPNQLWSGWDDALSRRDPSEIAPIVAALGHRLRIDGDASVYGEMVRRLSQPSRAVAERVAIIDALMFAATPDAAAALLQFLRETKAQTHLAGGSEDSIVQRSAQKAITSIAHTLIDGSRNWAIAPVLEQAWRTTGGSYSAQTIDVVARSIAYVGKPEGVAALIEVVSQAGPADDRYKAAVSAIEQLRANDPVSVLGEALQHSADNRNLSRTLVRGLMSIGTADAVSEVINYLNQQTNLDSAWRQEIKALLNQPSLSQEAKKVINDWKRKK